MSENTITPLITMKDFQAAQRARTTLDILVSSPDYGLKSLPTDFPAEYAFNGVYTGRMRTVARPDNGIPDKGACPPQPDDPPNVHEISTTRTTHYCVPLLESGTLRKK
jgi:hypothetical protein